MRLALQDTVCESHRTHRRQWDRRLLCGTVSPRRELLRIRNDLTRGQPHQPGRQLLSKFAALRFDKHKFRRFLPDDAVVAYKTGSLDALRTAAGILSKSSGRSSNERNVE